MATRTQVLIPITIAAIIIGVAGMISIPADVKLDSVEFPRGTIKLDDKILVVQIADTNSKVYAAVRINPDAILIKSIPGVGDYSSLVIASEIGGISRFNDSHKLCAYAGVVPSVRNSADTIHHGNITKRGSMTLRWVLTECIHTHAIHAKDSDITQFYNRIKKKRGSSKAAVAGASKILRVIYWMLKERREFVPNYS